MGKWAKIESSGGSIAGVATLEFGKTKVRVNFEDADKGQYTLPLSAFEEAREDGRVTFDPQPGKDYYVALDGKGQKFYSIRPANGIFKVRCVDFIRPDKEQQDEPEPITLNGQYGPYQVFRVKLEIVEGKFAGSTLTGQIPYGYFVEGDDGNVGLRFPKKSSSGFDTVDTFTALSGIQDALIPWDDENILPEMLTAVKKAKRAFNVALRDGYVTSYLPNNEEDEEEDAPVSNNKTQLVKKADLDDDDEDSKPVKRSTKVEESDFEEDEFEAKADRALDDED